MHAEIPATTLLMKTREGGDTLCSVRTDWDVSDDEASYAVFQRKCEVEAKDYSEGVISPSALIQ